MVLTIRYTIKPSHKYYKECEKLIHLSKNLYNQSLYREKQYFIFDGKYKSGYDLINEYTYKKQVDYYALSAHVVQQTVRMTDKNFKSFFKTNKDYKKNPLYVNGQSINQYYNKKHAFLKKVIPDAFDGIEDVVAHPLKLNVS